MKKYFFIALVVVIVAAAYYFFGINDTFKGSNIFTSGVNNSATTTRDFAYPVKVLSANSGRQYAHICNDSDTVIYLALDSESPTSTINTRIIPNSGIRLNAVSNANSCFDITTDNLYLGEVWATSTAAAKKIIFIEK